MDVPKKIKDDLADLKVLIYQEVDYASYNRVTDFRKFRPVSSTVLDDITTRMVYAASSECQQLNVQEYTDLKLTKELCNMHLENVVPFVLDYLKMHYTDVLFSMLSDGGWKGYDNEPHLTLENFKLYARGLLDESHCWVSLAIDADVFIVDDSKLSPMLAYYALVLVVELIIDGYAYCDRVEDMMNWMIQQIDERCYDYFAKYRESEGKSSSLDVSEVNNTVNLSTI